jgi:hypothetical protein
MLRLLALIFSELLDDMFVDCVGLRYLGLCGCRPAFWVHGRVGQSRTVGIHLNMLTGICHAGHHVFDTVESSGSNIV